MAPEKFTPDAGIYLGLRSIFWSLVRAKTDDDLRDVTARLWQMAVGIEDGDMSDAQAGLRNAEEALRQALERGATDQEIKQLMDQLRAAMDRYYAGDAGAAEEQAAARAAARPQCRARYARRTSRACSTGSRTWRATAPRMPPGNFCSSCSR